MAAYSECSYPTYTQYNECSESIKIKGHKQTETAFHKIEMDYWLRRTQEMLERVEAV